MNPADLAIWRTLASTVFQSTSAGFIAQHFPQVLFDYDTDGNMTYVGIAPRGAATSDTVWTIWNLSYSGNSMTSQKSSLPGVKWDDRTTTVTYA